MSNIIRITFSNQSKYLIINGGLPKTITLNKLNDNFEITYISNIQNKPWHYFYGGNLGYVISNYPLTNEKPKYYNYSCQIGNINNNIVYAQEIDQYRLKNVISI
jgi:hypothetical protein